jgi:hypothetical protein
MTKTPKQTQRYPTPRDSWFTKSDFSSSLERIRYPYHHQSFEDVIDILQDGIDKTKRKAVETIVVIPTIEKVTLDLRERDTEKQGEKQDYHTNHCCPLAKNKLPAKKFVAQCPTCIEK